MTTEKIYNELIIKWSKNMDFQQPLSDDNPKHTYRNPLCGDEITLELILSDGVIDWLNYRIRGCVLSKASSALFATHCRGMSKEKIEAEREEFVRFLATDPDLPLDDNNPFTIFSPVRKHRSRHSCLLLPFDTVLEYFSIYDR